MGDYLEMALEEQLGDYEEGDVDRLRYSFHNLFANLMSLAESRGVNLVDLVTEGVDLHSFGRGNYLPGGRPSVFLAECASKSRR